MKCAQAKPLLSPYLDGLVTGNQMRAIGNHLATCARCNQEYTGLRQTQQLLSKIGRRKAPDDLALKLRVAISQEAARSRRSYLEGVWVRLENALNAFILPAAAGLAMAILVFGFLIGFLALPDQLRAGNSDDVPLMLYTAPQLQQSAFSMGLDNIKDDSLVIEAYVDSRGRVEDYRILSHPKDAKELMPAVKNMLIFTTFRPATTMGRPTSGRAVLSFSKISVRG
jgi:hypothetical protein